MYPLETLQGLLGLFSDMPSAQHLLQYEAQNTVKPSIDALIGATNTTG